MRLTKEKSNKTIFLIGALALITLWAYYPSLFNGYVNYDDTTLISDAALSDQTALTKIPAIFSDTILGVYVPLTRLSFYIETLIFPFTPFPFHFNNLLLHICISILVFCFIQLLGFKKSSGFFAALLFAVHPMHVEAVAWIAERKTLLYSVFYLLAIIYHVKYIKLRRKGYLFLTVAFGFLSILSKPMALSLPLILLLIDWYLKRNDVSRIIFEKLVHSLYIVPITLITYLRHARMPGNNFLEGMTMWTSSLGFYIKKFIFPHPLVPIYELPIPVNILSGFYMSHFLVVLTTLLLCWIYRRQRVVVFAFLFMFLSIFFLLRFDVNTAADLTIWADRYMYLPSLGVCLMFGYSLDIFLQRRKQWHSIVAGLMVCYLVLLGISTNKQTKIWNNPFTLWNHELKYEPASAIAYEKRATDYVNRGNMVASMRDLEEALRLRPGFARAQFKYGRLLDHIGEETKAVVYYDYALKNDPKLEDAYIHLSRLYIKQKEFIKTVELLERSLEYFPENAVIWGNLGTSYYYLMNYSESLACLNRAIEIDPRLTSAYLNRGRLMVMSGKWEDALSDYSKALELDKDNDEIKQAIEYILNRER